MPDPVITGLAARREQLVTEVRRTEATLQRLLADIEHLDTAIRVFDRSYRPVSPAVSPLGTGGRITRTLLTILRKAPGPLTLRELTVTLMQTVGLDHKDRKRVKRLMEQSRTALARQLANGTVVKEMGAERSLVWRIKSR